MKIKKYLRTMLLMIGLTLTSCNNTDFDVTIRPDDYTLDYWIHETVKLDSISEKNIYSQDEQVIVYLDSHYVLLENDNKTLTLPKEYATYHLSIEDESCFVSSIYITDPNVEIYGMSMTTSSEEVERKFNELGFKYLPKYSGLDPCYSKNYIEFRIYSTYISIN